MGTRTREISLMCPNGYGEMRVVVPQGEQYQPVIIKEEGVKCPGDGENCKGGTVTAERPYDVLGGRVVGG